VGRPNRKAGVKEIRVLRHPNLRASSRGRSIGLWWWVNHSTASTAAVLAGVVTVLSPFHIHGGVWTPVRMLLLFPLFLQFCGLARCHDDDA
jgi:hypothetical protein